MKIELLLPSVKFSAVADQFIMEGKGRQVLFHETEKRLTGILWNHTWFCGAGMYTDRERGANRGYCTESLVHVEKFVFWYCIMHRFHHTEMMT